MNIIDGKKIAGRVKDKLAAEIFSHLQSGGRRPHLAIILAGDRPDSKLYVSLKEKAAREVGLDTSLYLIKKSEKEKDLTELIKFLNKDENIDGILVQLPLPPEFSSDKIMPLIEASKDVDGFNSGHLFSSPLFLAVEYSLAESGFDYTGKKAFLFFNSEIFRREMESFLSTWSISQQAVSGLEFNRIMSDPLAAQRLLERVREHDIILSAMGRPEVINQNFLRHGLTVIDIGISQVEGRVKGDIKFSDTLELNGYLTPVPGGIGPITVACLLKNVWQAYLLKIKS